MTWTVFAHVGNARWSFLTTRAFGATPEAAAERAAEDFGVEASNCIVFPTEHGRRITAVDQPVYRAEAL